MQHTAHTTLDAARSQTCARLINSAGEVFAERGYAHATIREICARADANLAAVNYHFRDKESLYAAVVAHAQLGHGMIDPMEPLPSTAPACEQRLREFILEYMLRLFDENRPRWNAQLIAREMIEPTPALDEVVRTTIRPRFLLVSRLVRGILGPAVTEPEVRMTVASIIGQCLIYVHCRPVMERLFDDEPYTKARTMQRAQHIIEFSLSALRGRQAPSTPRPKPNAARRTAPRSKQAAGNKRS